MALGVLNNLSAIYAENNLNNTNASLQTVLQQLSSGSRINSGADDAAGLSLVNGLAANSAALTQSETNATEGVGLLQVADGALSQVTSLLNRAITLATEASNGTLNSAQDSAANQEYQSILSEVTNIGSTTTYNQQQVFNGTNVAIYTGDSSTEGASVDDLNIHALSTGNVGDTNGVMSYSNGQSNTFIDLTATGSGAATLNDALSTTPSDLTVSYLATGPGGILTTKTTTISAGQNGFADTTQGLINAINASGLGLTASFATAAQAGQPAVSAGASTDTGILISGTGLGVGKGATPGLLGTITSPVDSVAGGSTDILSGTLTVVDSSGATHALTLGGTGYATLSDLANTINSAGYGISAKFTAGTATTSASIAFSSTSSKASVTPTGVEDTNDTNAPLTWTAGGAFYNIGVTNGNGGADLVQDAATGQSATSVVTADPNGLGGIATIGYSDAAGVNLSSTGLTTQVTAQAALGLLNQAISDVAAQDGYIGAQINTLNSISQVMSTQQENVTSAQNAVQATDYAAATSNMSKYEILSQTGIAALAQANSVQQEVTKLLQ